MRVVLRIKLVKYDAGTVKSDWQKYVSFFKHWIDTEIAYLKRNLKLVNHTPPSAPRKRNTWDLKLGSTCAIILLLREVCAALTLLLFMMHFATADFSKRSEKNYYIKAILQRYPWLFLALEKPVAPEEWRSIKTSNWKLRKSLEDNQSTSSLLSLVVWHCDSFIIQQAAQFCVFSVFLCATFPGHCYYNYIVYTYQ